MKFRYVSASGSKVGVAESIFLAWKRRVRVTANNQTSQEGLLGQYSGANEVRKRKMELRMHARFTSKASRFNKVAEGLLRE